MVPHTACISVPDYQLDVYLTQANVRFSSSPFAREAARAWLAAHDSASGNGASEGEAEWKPKAAFRLVVDGSPPPLSISQAKGTWA
jgi:hypothetical protein